MRSRRLARIWLAMIATLGPVGGCDRQPSEPPPNSAARAARDYYRAVIRRDWPAARALTAAAPRPLNPQQFERLFLSRRRAIGFEPEEVLVGACEEHGDNAIAHVVLTSTANQQRHRYKDAVSLRRGTAGWLVVVPDPRR